MNINARWNTVVGMRGGKPVIRWTGVANVVGLIAATAGGAFLLGWLGGATWVPYLVSGNIVILGSAALVARILIESHLPPDQLPRLDGRR